jgi:hypothetical protein
MSCARTALHDLATFQDGPFRSKQRIVACTVFQVERPGRDPHHALHPLERETFLDLNHDLVPVRGGENSGVRMVPTASDTGISTTEYRHGCAGRPPAKAFGPSKRAPRIPLIMPVNCPPNIRFIFASASSVPCCRCVGFIAKCWCTRPPRHAASRLAVVHVLFATAQVT